MKTHHSQEIQTLGLESSELKARLFQSEKDLEEYKKERELEDLLVVKFEIEAINEAMLTNHSTKIEDLEIEKAKLEAKIA